MANKFKINIQHATGCHHLGTHKLTDKQIHNIREITTMGGKRTGESGPRVGV